MGLELRRRLERLLGTTLSSTVVWNYPTVDTLAAELASRLEPQQPQDAEPAGRLVPALRVAAEGPEPEPAADAENELEALQRELAEVEAMMGEL